LDISICAIGDSSSKGSTIDYGYIMVAIPEELDIDYEETYILLTEHDTGDPQVATNAQSLSFDAVSSLFEQGVNRGEIGENLFNAAIGLVVGKISPVASLFWALISPFVDLTPSQDSISTPEDSKFNDENNYDILVIPFVGSDEFDVHEVSALIPLEGDFEGRSIAIIGLYNTEDTYDIRQFYKESIVLGSTTPPSVSQTTNSIGMEFVLIPAGEFDMGSPSDEEGRHYWEGPLHHVTIEDPFYMGKYEVTQAQWCAIMGDNPSNFAGDDDRPVECVSWDDVQDFIRKLNEKEGTDKYRLPSEAEWEYACRAGTSTRYSFGDDDDYANFGDYAWYYSNSGSQTHPVGQKKPNPWGLYDMHGNVLEWVQDCRHSDYIGAPADGSAWIVACEYDYGSPYTIRVIRGGSWCGDGVEFCRSASRRFGDPHVRSLNLGFRLLREV
jgi:formylglycine-generating enzyme required for sulfatase activity